MKTDRHRRHQEVRNEHGDGAQGETWCSCSPKEPPNSPLSPARACGGAGRWCGLREGYLRGQGCRGWQSCGKKVGLKPLSAEC